jgi:hypothetical protein
MKKQVWTMLARLQLGKFLMAAKCRSALLGMVPPPAQGQVVNSTQNPEQIAISHWYAANQTTTFVTGTTPNSVAFDGSNIWLSIESNNTVTELQPSTGKVVGPSPWGPILTVWPLTARTFGWRTTAATL